jgi:hypothetical protein
VCPLWVGEILQLRVPVSSLERGTQARLLPVSHSTIFFCRSLFLSFVRSPFLVSFRPCYLYIPDTSICRHSTYLLSPQVAFVYSTVLFGTLSFSCLDSLTVVSTHPLSSLFDHLCLPLPSPPPRALYWLGILPHGYGFIVSTVHLLISRL